MTNHVAHGAVAGSRLDQVDLDPISTQVIRHSLDAAADQMMIALRRTAFSPIIYDGRDFAGAFYDPQVRLLAETKTLPVFAGALGFCLAHTLDAIGGLQSVTAGDVYVLNYAYHTGSHQNDVAFIVPCFIEGELTCFAVLKAHYMDVGGAWVFATHTTDIWQEGTIYPSVRLYRGGELNEDLYRTILANSRTPEICAGDIAAQVGACQTGLDAVTRLVGRFGLTRFRDAVELIFEYGEHVMAELVETIPDGEYSAECIVDNDGISEDEIPFRLDVRVSGATIDIDFTDSPDQRPGPVNCTPPTVVACVRCAMMALLGGDETANEGHFRPITIWTRPGSMFHAFPPAPMGMYSWPSMHAVDHIHRALAEVIPDKVTAQGGSDGVNAINAWGRRDDGSFWADATQHPGGQGAAASYGDGGSPLLHITCSATRATSRELWESRTPFLVERFELAVDSGGAGQFRGGLGVDTTHRVLSDLHATILWERTKSEPFGLFGGQPGRQSRIIVEFPDGETRTYSKASVVLFPAGTVLHLETGGGGGYGPPAKREPADVLADIQDGYITDTRARLDYPHAFDD